MKKEVKTNLTKTTVNKKGEKPVRVLILDDSKIESTQIKTDIQEVLGSRALIDVANELEAAKKLLSEHTYELGIFDVCLKNNALGTNFLKSCRNENIPTPKKVIFCTNYADEKTAHVAMGLSATLLPKREGSEDMNAPLVQVLKNIFDPVRKTFTQAFPGNSTYAQELREVLYLSYRNQFSPVLISGPKGSGKRYLSKVLIQAIQSHGKTALDAQTYFDCQSPKVDVVKTLSQALEAHKTEYFPHVILEHADAVPAEKLSEIASLLEKHLTSVKVVFLATRPQNLLSHPVLNRILTHHLELWSLAEREEDLEEIVSCLIDQITTGIHKRLDSKALEALRQHLPETMGELHTLLLKAVARSQNNYYITHAHLFGNGETIRFQDFDLSRDQYEKLQAFCLLVKKLREQGCDQVDIYKHISKLRAGMYREDYAKDYHISNLPARSTLVRILDRIKSNKNFELYKNKIIHDMTLQEAVAFRK